jgi:dihydrofolate synthase/folylpolyglutamate synthase
MTYKETIDYLFAKLPLYSRIGAAAYKEYLDNTIRLCKELDNPHAKFKSIHVAGTNGKGSVSHMLAAILQTAGYKTGLYTSPHLKDFRERIKINGELVTEQFIIEFTGKMKPLIEEIQPSFFEITVAMAFEYFAQEKTDIAIIEVGLGGRLDSTNIIIPEISVITNIGKDHMNMLGDSIEKIAEEKAGIIKQGVPVIIGEATPTTSPIFEKKARSKAAPVYFAGRQRQALSWKWEKHELVIEVADKTKADHQVYRLDLQGIYQIKNLLPVLEACSLLEKNGWKINDSNIRTALQHVKKLTGLHGRWEIIHHSPDIVLDVGHNEDGIRQIMEQVEVTDHHELHIVTGMAKDKDVDSILKLFPGTAHYYFTQANIPRAMDAENLMQKAESFGLKGRYYPDVNIALEEAKLNAKKNDLIIVCGSVFLIAEVT